MTYTYNEVKPILGEGTYLAPDSALIGSVTLGKGASVWFHATLRADVNSITIGEQTNIQDNVVMHVTNEQALSIGNRCTVGHGAILHACTIENDCLIGMGAIILDGSHIEQESLVAAGSLVPPNKHYPKRSLLMGSPAKVVRELSDEEVRNMHENSQEYWILAKDLAEGKQTIT